MSKTTMNKKEAQSSQSKRAVDLYVGIELTHCNLGCAYCYEASLHEYHLKTNLQFSDTVSGLLNLKKTGLIKYVVFTGGEPTLHPQIDVLLAITKLLGFRTSISTNSMYLFRKDTTGRTLIEKLCPYLDTIAISLDGPNAEINDSIRVEYGTLKPSGQFNHVLKFFEWYRERPILRAKHLPPLKVNTIIIQPNKDSILDIGELLVKTFPPDIIQWKLEEFIPRGKGRQNKKLSVPREEVQMIVQQARERFGDHLVISPRQYEDGKPYPFLLILANGLITIPTGELHPAIELNGKKINVHEPDAAELLREWVHQNHWFLSGNERINSYRRYENQSL